MTKKIQNLKGFRDFLPEEAARRAWLKSRMISVFEKWGYEPLQTPTLEYLELFEGEIGEDEKLFYKFTDPGGREVALRYDQTVPTCRVVGQYQNELIFPFRRYQIQPNFRAEKPQKGRYREFEQADIDIFGIEGPEADAEAIALSISLYLELGFDDVVALINNRDLMKGIPYEAISSVDKLEKIGDERVINDMKKKGISEDDAKGYLDKIKNIQPDEKLNKIFSYLKTYGIDDKNYKFEPTLARSFSYSEGPIWEMKIPSYSAGSVGGGERYDALMERISGQKIAATGIAFGIDRTLEALIELNKLPKIDYKPEVLVSVFNSELLNKSLEVVKKLREGEIRAEVYPDSSSKLNKQIKYADKKGIKWVVVIGPEENENNLVNLKNMESGEQESVDVEEIPKKIREF